MTHMYVDLPPVEFNEDNAPDWLKFGGREGSTMDNRWFWNRHVMTLEVGGTVNTDHQTIKRVS